MTGRLVRFAFLGAGALLLALAANTPGRAEIDWFGWTLSFHPVWLAVALGALLVAWYFLERLWTWVRFRSGLAGPARTLRRQQAARPASAAALSAWLAGQEKRARKLAADALDIDHDDWTASVVAAFAGDAEQIERLQREEATRPVAALAKHRLSPTRDNAEAAALAAPASSAAWAAVTEARARDEDFEAAEAALANWRALDDDIAEDASWIGATLAHAAALEAKRRGATDAARREAARALKLQPAFAPAALLLAEIAPEDPAGAEAAIERAWAAAPHPALRTAYARLRPMESEDERLARVERLAAKNPHHAESGIAVAEQALAAGDPSRAIEALGPQLSGDAVRIEAARLALDAYQRLGMDPPAHAGWIDAAATGAPPPGWRCSACGTGTGTWQSECPHCSRIGRIRPDGI